MQPGTHRARLGQNLAELGQHVLDATTDQRAAGGIGTQKSLGGGVADRNDAAFIEPDDARRHSRQGGLDESAPFVVERVGRSQGLMLPPQFPGHLVESFPEMAEIALGFVSWHLHIEIACGDLVGGANEATDRADELIGESQAHPDRGDQQGQRKHDEHAGETQLDISSVAFEIGECGRDVVGIPRHLFRDRIDRAARIEETLVDPVDRPQSDEDVAAGEQSAKRLTRSGVGEIGRGGSGDQLAIGALGHLGDAAVRRDDRGDGEIQRARPAVQIRLELLRIVMQKACALREIAGRQFRVAQQGLALGFPIQPRRGGGFVDELRNVLHEGGIDRPFDRNRRDDRGHERRDRRDQSEERDHARMQTRARARRSPGGPQIAQFQSDHDQETESHQAVAGQDRQDDPLRRDYRGKAGENDECGERQNQRRADRHGPKTPRGATFQSRIGENNRWFAATRVGLRGHVPNRGHVSPGMNDSLVAVRQLCCKIATKTRRRLFESAQTPQIKVPNFLAERVSVQTQNFRGLDLVAAGCRQGRGEQGRLQLA